MLKDLHFKLALYGVCVCSNFQISHLLLTGGGRKRRKLGSLLGLLCLMCLKSAMSLSNAAVVNAAQETVNVERLIYNVLDYVFVLEIVTSDTSVVINFKFLDTSTNDKKYVFIS